ncbi:hypothetical protein ACFWY9_21540 [Amycolatopsis sp. NPDC059027]|uniref:hypothetical protein n=1 Tax=unclassified Amycolatopsis TaxID=2618356 RepID=UPI00366A8217
MTKASKQRNPFQPLRGIAEVLSIVFWLLLILAVFQTLYTAGWWPGAKRDTACVDAADIVSSHITGDLGANLKPGTRPSAAVTSLCVEQPSAGQRFAHIGDQLPQVVFIVGALIVLLHFLKTATRNGPYADVVPGKLRGLGWYLLIGGPVLAMISALARFFLRRSMVTDLPSGSWFSDWVGSLPWWAIVAGAAALSFARILRIGSRMREDLEGTI